MSCPGKSWNPLGTLARYSRGAHGGGCQLLMPRGTACRCWEVAGRLASTSLLMSEQKPEPSQRHWHHQERQPMLGHCLTLGLSWHCPWGYCETFQELTASLTGPGRWVL